MIRRIFKGFLIFLLLLLIPASYFFLGEAPKASSISWGVNFSQKHAQALGLEWKEVYEAILNDLKVKKIKVAFHWDLIETSPGVYNFADIDWQLAMAAQSGAMVIPVIGIKTTRWPECHIPEWISGDKLEQETLKVVEAIVSRYNDNPAVLFWQVENEPFFNFGICPQISPSLIIREVIAVKSLDPDREVMITDSGELSLWWKAARTGDIVGVTTYRTVWSDQLKKYVNYPLPPVSYWRKAVLVNTFFGKKVIGAELQGEPWGKMLLYDSPLEEQEKTMNVAKLRENIIYAERTGFSEFYFWGSEWWYWMKQKQEKADIWEEVKRLWK